MPWSGHSHIASQTNSPTREGRELWFAQDPQNDAACPETTPEKPKGQPEGEYSSGIAHDIAAATREGLVRAAPETLSEYAESVDHIIHSPAMLWTLLASDLVELEELRALARTLLPQEPDDQNLIGQIVAHLRAHPQDAERMRPLAERIVKDADATLLLSKALDQRLEKYRMYQRIMEKHMGTQNITTLDFERIEAFDKALQDFNGMTFDSWLRAVQKKQPIPPPRTSEQAAQAPQIWQSLLDMVGGQAPELAQYPSAGAASADDVFHRIREAILLRKSVDRMQADDTPVGEEPTVFQDATVERVQHKADALRTLLDAEIQQHAAFLGEQLNERRHNLLPDVDDLDALTPEQEAERLSERYGVSTKAIRDTWGQLYAPSVRALRGNAQPEQNAVAPDHPQYHSEAETALRAFRDTEEALDKTHVAKRSGKPMENVSDAEWFETQVANQRLKHGEAIAAATAFFEAMRDPAKEQFLRSMLPVADGHDYCDELCAAAKPFRPPNQPTDADYQFLYDWLPPEKTEQLMTLLAITRQPAYMEKLQQQLDTPEEEMEKIDTTVVRRQLQAVEKQFFPEGGGTCTGLQHPIAKALPITKALQTQIKKAYEQLASNESAQIQQAGLTVQMLQSAYDQLDTFSRAPDVKRFTGEQFKKRTNTDNPRQQACYDMATGEILLNTDILKTADEEQRAVEHEMGHGIIDILTRRSGILAGLHLQLYERLRATIPEGGAAAGQTFQTLLEAQASRWAVDPGTPNFHEYLIDELIVRYAQWIKEGKSAGAYSEEERTLFRLLEQHDLEYAPEATLANMSEHARGLLFAIGGGGGAPLTPQQAQDLVRSADIVQDIRYLDRDFFRIQEFLQSHTMYRDLWNEAHTKTGGDAFAEMQEELACIKTDLDATPNTNKQQEKMRIAAIVQRVEALKKRRDGWIKLVDTVTGEEIANVQLAEMKTGHKSFTMFVADLNLMSINNLISMGKSVKEDWMRMWKRRSEAVEAQLGMRLTSVIPTWIPYAGRLENEFRRRAQQSELDEVEQWKKSLTNLDSWTLEERLGDPRNKDEIKAIIELLAERGRLDWNSGNLMTALNRLSHFEMPITECQKNDVLRDKWFLKLISDIWDDKEKYYEWRRKNDSGISSEKQKFTASADQFSNLKNGLSNELGRQLKKFVEARGLQEAGRKDEAAELMEAVNPHLYEEIIDYSIRNGKMSMEDKFFYIIQGVRHGILSIDRLRVLAGEGGKIVNIFPFIDYFYQKNNSMEEIIELGKRLDEGGEFSFTPGKRTSMFIWLEIAREKSVKERLRKGQGKQGENIDHDDVGYFIAQLDQTAVDNWYGAYSGTRQKLSPEALKNSYVGFSMKFKSYAALQAMQNNVLHTADLQNLAQSLGSYMLSDNILTQYGHVKESRPKLSQYEMEFQTAVTSQKNATVLQYREALNTFVNELLKAYLGDTKSTDANWATSVWKEVNQELGLCDSSGKPASGKKQDELIDAGNFIGLKIGKLQGNAILATNIFQANAKITERLQEKITADPEKFLGILKKHGDKLLGDAIIGGDVKIDDLSTAYRDTLSAA